MSRPEPPLAPSGVKLVESGPNREVWQGVGTLRLNWSRTGGVVHFMLAGHGQGEFAAPIMERWDGAARQSSKVTLLLDFWDMPTYDSKLRIDLTGWARKHFSQVDRVHLIARSKIVIMGATIANIALDGIITIYQQRAPFDGIVKQFGFPARPAV